MRSCRVGEEIEDEEEEFEASDHKRDLLVKRSVA